MKKKILFVLCLFCLFMPNVFSSSITYELEITKQQVLREKITYSLENFTDIQGGGYNYQDKVYGDMEVYTSESGKDNINYTKNLSKDGNDYTIIFSYDHSASDFNKSDLLNRCFDNFQYSNSEDEYSFKATGSFYCLGSNEINIYIKTTYPEVVTNAVKVEDNLYRWTINEEKVNLNMTISNEKSQNDSNETSKNLKIVIYVFASLALTIVIVVLFLKNKSNKNNKI